MSDAKECRVPSWVWLLELVKIIALLGARYWFGISWGLSILITFIAGIVFVLCVWFGFRTRRKAKNED